MAHRRLWGTEAWCPQSSPETPAASAVPAGRPALLDRRASSPSGQERDRDREKGRLMLAHSLALQPQATSSSPAYPRHLLAGGFF